MSKYGAQKINIDGITFDSKIEAKFYEKCKEDKAKGLILNFELQPRFTLQPKYNLKGKNVRKIEYVADFMIYYDDLWIDVIDIKGMATSEAKLKRKMYDYQYPNPLKWIVWNKGLWRDYDVVIRERAKVKRLKKKAEKEGLKR